MSEFTDDLYAFYYGYTDATNYEAFNTNPYDFSDEGVNQYRAGFTKGMDRNIFHENGMASEPNYQQVFGEI